ncbi:hypothetical protein [Pontiella sp.]|uniref:hypothetical protein n=1 Tax=Pontiella sp. TaxID=2837462 RepID=UPI00356A9AFC
MIGNPRSKTRFLLATTGLALSLAASGAVVGKANIRFKGTSTLHDFEGTVPARPFSATVAAGATNGQMVVCASTVLRVDAMTTEHKKRDKNMLNMLDQSNYAEISGSLTNAPISLTEKTAATLHLKIRDVEQQVPVVLSDWTREGDLMSGLMSFPVSLKTFKLQAPTVMGIIRVGDTVDVECTILIDLNHQPAGD